MPGRFVSKIRNLKSPKNILKQSKIIEKLIVPEENKKSRSSNNFSKEFFQPGNVNNIVNRKMNILNSFYKDHVADSLVNGKNNMILQNLGVEITKVRLDRDYKNLNIYWISKNYPADDLKIARILNGLLGEIQSEINSLINTGLNPNLRFVKDEFAEKEFQIEKILDQLKLNNELTSKDYENTIKISEKYELPQMRNDIFGLYHSDIMQRIMSSTIHVKREEPELTKITDKELNEKVFLPANKKNLNEYLRKNYILLKKMQNLKNRVQNSKYKESLRSEFEEDNIFLEEDLYDED